jgi:5-methylcytosine-specific restriction endonuclease McrA
MKRGIIKRKATNRSKEGQQAITAFRKRWPCCWFCGAKSSAPHHIVFRRGVVFDDQRNLAAVCEDCHSRIHDITIVKHNGKRFLPIPLETVLRVKRERDPPLDLPFLRELSGRLNFGEGLE